jgi:type IV pilus assembly protein PilA
MSTLNNRLQLALLKRKRSGNALQKGFTLVELMIVIVIVGILSAVALPNFLNQTGKAKGTEAKTKLSGLLKEAHAEFMTDGSVTTTQTTLDSSVNNAKQAGIFDYAVTVADPITTGTATGKGTDSGIDNTVVYNGCVNLDTGKVSIGNTPGASADCT